MTSRSPDQLPATVAVGAVLLALWEILPATGVVSGLVLPRFSAVVSALWTLLSADFFARHLVVTLTEILLGFGLGSSVGLVGGIAFATSPVLKRLVYPFVVAFQAVPKVVLAPLFIVWFGFGYTSKVVMAVTISFFPVLINTVAGLESVPDEVHRLMRSLGARPRQVFLKVSLPHALPIVFAGLKAGATFAVIGVMVAEFVGASEGLGYLLHLYSYQLRVDRVFAVTLVLAFIGAGSYFVLEWADRTYIFWRGDEGF